MRIAIGADHRGFGLKQAVIRGLGEAGYSYNDFGCYTTEPVDYPDIARKVAEAVAGGGFELGILICGTGIGMSIAANKVKGIRAALCHNVFSARRARGHNDANVLCLGARQNESVALRIVAAFLASEFEGGRHALRVDKIRAMENTALH